MMSLWKGTVLATLLGGCSNSHISDSKTESLNEATEAPAEKTAEDFQLQFKQANDAFFTQKDFEEWELEGIWESDSLHLRGSYVFGIKGRHLFLETPTQGLEKPKISYFGGLSPSKDVLVLSRRTPNGPPAISIINVVQKSTTRLEGLLQIQSGEMSSPTTVVLIKK